MTAATQANLHTADVGTQITVTFRDQDEAALDISTATARVLSLEKPDGSVIERTLIPVGDGSDGVARYTLAAGDLDTDGRWRLQGRVAFAGGLVYHSHVIPLRVWPNNPAS